MPDNIPKGGVIMTKKRGFVAVGGFLIIILTAVIFVIQFGGQAQGAYQASQTYERADFVKIVNHIKYSIPHETSKDNIKMAVELFFSHADGAMPRNAYFEDFDYLLFAFGIEEIPPARQVLESFFHINDPIFHTFMLAELFYGCLQIINPASNIIPAPLPFFEEPIHLIDDVANGNMSYLVLPNTSLVIFYIP
jgi:hypothetical protein